MKVRASGLAGMAVALMSMANGCGPQAAEGQSTVPVSQTQPAPPSKAVKAGARSKIESETLAERKAARAAAAATSPSK